jgi:hypothetical protein
MLLLGLLEVLLVELLVWLLRSLLLGRGAGGNGRSRWSCELAHDVRREWPGRMIEGGERMKGSTTVKPMRGVERERGGVSSWGGRRRKSGGGGERVEVGRGTKGRDYYVARHPISQGHIHIFPQVNCPLLCCPLIGVSVSGPRPYDVAGGGRMRLSLFRPSASRTFWLQRPQSVCSHSWPSHFRPL